MANCDGCGKKIGLLDSSNDYNGKLFCIRCYGNIPVKKNEDEVDQISEQQKDNAGSFEAIAFLGKVIFLLGGAISIVVIILASADGEAILIAPAIATLVFSLVFGALLVALGFIGLELSAIRKGLNSSGKSSTEN
jgi:hypothetical protein